MENRYLAPDQHDLLRVFIDEQVRFLIVDGHAFAAHAFIRTTKDIDLWIEATPKNARRVWDALMKYGAPLAAHQVQPRDFQARDLVYQMGVPPVRIDLITNIADIDFEAAWKQRIDVELSGMRVPVIGLSHLIQAKEAAGRPQNLLDVQSLLNVQRRESQ
ncbi:MAG: hypothetical protein IT445_20110 [Phycisphaeraceae bacterium]|nr:hypothetical protein [Phycisphaeraceae bacterium]